MSSCLLSILKMDRVTAGHKIFTLSHPLIADQSPVHPPGSYSPAPPATALLPPQPSPSLTAQTLQPLGPSAALTSLALAPIRPTLRICSATSVSTQGCPALCSAPGRQKRLDHLSPPLSPHFLSISGAGTLGVPLGGTRRVGGLLGVAERLSGTVSLPFLEILG